MEVSGPHLYRYQAFNGIWGAIDDNNMRRLELHPDLHSHINEKQQGVTPLHLVRNCYSVHEEK